MHAFAFESDLLEIEPSLFSQAACFAVEFTCFEIEVRVGLCFVFFLPFHQMAHPSLPGWPTVLMAGEAASRGWENASYASGTRTHQGEKPT
jgi:hypothetical protein